MASQEDAPQNFPEIRGLYPSDHIEVITPPGHTPRPMTVKHMSVPAYQSPIRHHRRTHSSTRPVKETLNARSEYHNSEDDGSAQHRINQYIIKQEIGRGSFGAVHLAVDQYGQEYAIKEFSKSRLRKRAQSNLLRRPDAAPRAGRLGGFNSPLHRQYDPSPGSESRNNALDLIKEEIAIMKKLHHPNLVALFEVLDDPDEDSLYMVLEMCQKGVVMKVGLEDRADPYEEEQCRCWFRDMILGIEYLHAQGVVHRDIKPDNCLITSDDVLKIVDFGVSEMFEKQDDMKTAKSAGSPAFMPPELCVAKHGEVSGKAADIWSMGITLYCLRFGKIPFEKTGVLELYGAIREDTLEIAPDCSEDLANFLHRILEKDPHKRISMDDIRIHPWVTRKGTDGLLSKEENTAELVEPPTQEEFNNAITGNMGHLMVVIKAVKRFKELLFRKRPDLMEGIFGRASKFVHPPSSMQAGYTMRKSKSFDADDRHHIEGHLAAEGLHKETNLSDSNSRTPLPNKAKAMLNRMLSSDKPQNHEPNSAKEGISQPIDFAAAAAEEKDHVPGKGHARNPLEETLFLDIGSGADAVDGTVSDIHVVSESPGAVEINVYEQAYQEEIQRILAAKRNPTLYLTRRVENNETFRKDERIIGQTADVVKSGFSRLIENARANARADQDKTQQGQDGGVEK
ncbi:Pkinase-domain-containing protein [Aulographum hederae CBS 113979]|uniref:Pkinase-domain-containing protein n=1 Tax=Aulographum hederae CBS 113979 TaxID=1176131 RepID=A0A6G1GRI0_9PEZI|nr:Pkinase-domain-containing protein [Aulographum hederae CBS 113979]